MQARLILGVAALGLVLLSSVTGAGAQQSPWEKRQQESEEGKRAVRFGEGVRLSEEEIRTLVSGKTLEEIQRWTDWDTTGQRVSFHAVHYLGPDGKGGMGFGNERNGTRDAEERWFTKDGMLCFQSRLSNRGQPRCGHLRRVESGTLYLDFSDKEGRVRAVAEVVSLTEGDYLDLGLSPAERRKKELATPCDQLYDRKPQIQSCLRERKRLAERQAQMRNLLAGTYLSGEEARQLLAGKTLIETPKALPNRPPASKNQVFTYFDPSGEAFLASGEGGYAMRWRGNWTIKGDQFCLPGAYWPCARLRRASDGKLYRDYYAASNEPDEVTSYGALVLEDGDGHGVVKEVERWPGGKKKTEPPRNSQPSPGLAGPSMGQ